MRTAASVLMLAVSAATGQTLDTVIRFPREVDRLFHVPEGNKLYVTAYVRDSSTNHIHVLDCSTLSVRAVIRTGAEAGFSDPCAAWCPGHNKVYIGVYPYSSPDTAGLLVIDNATDSVVRRLPAGVYMRGITHSPTSDKLYAVGATDSYRGMITVLDCTADTVLATIAPADYSPAWIALWDSVGNKVYVGCGSFTNPDRVTAIDCYTDSVVAVIRSRIWWPSVGAYSPLGRKVYLGAEGDWGVCAIDCLADAVIARFDNIWSQDDVVPAYCRAEDKLYWYDFGDHPPDSIYVIDCRTDSVVHRILAPRGSSVWYIACADWSNRLYVASRTPSPHVSLLTVFDCRTDSIIGQTRFGIGSPREIVCNPVDHRIYVSVRSDSAVYVFTEELQPIQEQPLPGQPVPAVRVWPNPARHQLWLGNPGPVLLFSVCGRRVMDLQPGINDIRHLVPGIYFLRSPGGGERSAVRKVIVTR